MAEGAFVRVYHEDLRINHPAVWEDLRALGEYTHLLALADKLWPTPPDLPRRVSRAALRVLVDAELVTLLPDDRYRIRGLDGLREARVKQTEGARESRWPKEPVEGGKRPSRKARFKVLERDGFKCRYCGRGAPEVRLDVDHVVPFREGGTDDPSNLLAACVDCNSGKSGHPLGISDSSVTDQKHIPRARGRSGLVVSGQVVSPEERAPGEKPPPRAPDARMDAELEQADALVAYHSLTGRFPVNRVAAWLEQLAADHGHAELSAALAVQYAADSNIATLLSRTRDALELEAHEARKAREKRQRQQDAEERRRIEEMPLEQRQANLARLRREMAERGLIPPQGGQPS
jgi:5-methylcytosine-specific restriction endonuclease McrA